MIETPRLGLRRNEVLRSQLAVEVALTAFALAGAALLLRVALLLLEPSARVWTVATIYAMTDPLVWPLTLVPGGNRPLLGAATLADLTAVALLALVPLALLARGRPG